MYNFSLLLFVGNFSVSVKSIQLLLCSKMPHYKLRPMPLHHYTLMATACRQRNDRK